MLKARYDPLPRGIITALNKAFNRNKVITVETVDEVLQPSGLILGDPCVLDYDQFQLAGYYTGYNSSTSKIGFAKGQSEKRHPGYVTFKTHLRRADDHVILEDNRIIHMLPNRDLEAQVQDIPLGTIVEVAVWPNVGHMGYWQGIQDGRTQLAVAFNKQTQQYYDVVSDWQHVLLGWEQNDNYAGCYEFPRLDTVTEIAVLKAGKHMGRDPE